MNKIITFFSYGKDTGKTTTIFNIGKLLTQKKFKVAIFELSYNSKYFDYLNLTSSKLKTRNLFKCYSRHDIDNNLSIFTLNETFENDNDLLRTEISKWKNNYDYILIELPWLKNNLLNLIINEINMLICIFDTLSFSSEILIKTITSLNEFKKANKKINFEIFILNKYINQDSNSLAALSQLNKILPNSTKLKIISFDDNLLNNNKKILSYAIDEFSPKYSIELNEIVKLL